MKKTVIFVLILAIFYLVDTLPVEEKDKGKDSKSAFGTAFDEIVVESYLTVRRKAPSGNRQSRNQNVTEIAPIKVKRELSFDGAERRKNKHHVKSFGSSMANAQSFNVKGPLGAFGASASSSQSQNFGPGGILASFAGTQQYVFNDRVFDVSFGNVFGPGAATVSSSKRTRTPPG